MAFDVYPNQPSPLKVPKAPSPGVPTSSLPQLVTQHAAPYPPWQVPGGYEQAMFIGVAMTGVTATPTFQLQAGNGAALTLTGNPTRINSDATGTRLGDAWVKPSSTSGLPVTASANVFDILVGFDQTPTVTWNLTIQNNDTANDGYFAWVVADNPAETAQPWVDAVYLDTSTSPPTPASTLSYQVLTGDKVSDSFRVSNYGTASFDVTALSPALSSGFSLGPGTTLPLTIPSGTQHVLTVDFTAPSTPPMPDGVTTVTPTLTTNPVDPNAVHNQQFTVKAKTEQLEVVLLLDDSGSMTWDPDGNALPAGSNSARWWELRDASSQFLDLLAFFGSGRGSYGVAKFPPSDPANTSTFDLEDPPFKAIPSDMTATKGAIAAVTPTNSTPMGDGLEHVLNPVNHYFKTDDLSLAADRRWLILMSDGAQNSGTHQPSEAIAPGQGLKEKKIKMFALAYGVQGHSNVDHDLLTTLESNSYSDADGGGQIGVVDIEGQTAVDFAGAMRNAIKTGLRELGSSSDPSAVFLIGQSEARHDVLLTPHDDKAAFAINWNTPDASRLQLELLSPACEVITPDNAGRGPLSQVTFRGGDRYQTYYFDSGFLANPGGQPRYGTWTMLVTVPLQLQALPADRAAAAGASPVYEYYSYDLMAESTLRMRLTLDQAAYYAGDPVVVSARLTAAGVPLTGASVVLSTTAPAQSQANWLAGLSVPADALAQAAERLKGQDATPILVKTLAAEIAGLRFDAGAQQGDLVMTDPSRFGVYQATYTGTSVPEHRTLYVTATGLTPDGLVFRREGKLELFVQVRPDPVATILTLHFGAGGTAIATVFPRDKFGNVLFTEPRPTGGLQLVASGASFTGPLVNNLDGSYSRPLTVTGPSPAVGVQFNGQDVIPVRPVPPVADLHYVDEVIRFDAGAIASANQHNDPQAVLGSIDGKPAGTFVSLGAGGQLTVGFRRRVIVAEDGGDDITVFIQPDDDLRSYRLEAYSTEHRHDDDDDDDDNGHDDDNRHGHRRHWVSLGESIGVTQSFSLRAAGLEHTPALRITDTSGRARGADLSPLTTPGVSVLGVGVLKTGRDRPFDLEDVPDWLSRLWQELT